jgi:hypothetical protein
MLPGWWRRHSRPGCPAASGNAADVPVQPAESGWPEAALPQALSLPGSVSAAINLQLRFSALSHIIAAVLQFSDGFRCRAIGVFRKQQRGANASAKEVDERYQDYFDWIGRI